MTTDTLDKIAEICHDAPPDALSLIEKLICGDSGKGNIVIAGDEVYAGIDDDDRSTCLNAFVVEFASAMEMGKAMRAGRAEFTVFETRKG